MTSYADDLNRVVTAVLKARQAEIRHYRHSSAGLRSRGMPVKERYDTPLDRLCDAVLDGVEPFVLPDDAPPDTDEIDMTELTPRQRFYQLRAQGVSRYQAAKALGLAPSSVYGWEDKDGNPIEAKRSYTKRATAEPAPAPAPAPAPVPAPVVEVNRSLPNRAFEPMWQAALREIELCGGFETWSQKLPESLLMTYIGLSKKDPQDRLLEGMERRKFAKQNKHHTQLGTLIIAWLCDSARAATKLRQATPEMMYSFCDIERKEGQVGELHLISALANSIRSGAR